MPGYQLAVTDLDGKPVDGTRHGPYYVKARAERQAVVLSRQYSSPNTLVVLETLDEQDNVIKARCYRMGRLYKP